MQGYPLVIFLMTIVLVIVTTIMIMSIISIGFRNKIIFKAFHDKENAEYTGEQSAMIRNIINGMMN